MTSWSCCPFPVVVSVFLVPAVLSLCLPLPFFPWYMYSQCFLAHLELSCYFPNILFMLCCPCRFCYLYSLCCLVLAVLVVFVHVFIILLALQSGPASFPSRLVFAATFWLFICLSLLPCIFCLVHDVMSLLSCFYSHIICVTFLHLGNTFSASFRDVFCHGEDVLYKSDIYHTVEKWTYTFLWKSTLEKWYQNYRHSIISVSFTLERSIQLLHTKQYKYNILPRSMGGSFNTSCLPKEKKMGMHFEWVKLWRLVKK